MKAPPPNAQGAEPLPGSAGPLDIAMDAERHDPAPDSPARLLLARQSRLVDEQIALARNERFRNRIKAARDAALAALAAALVAGAGWVVWDASRADGVVIEPFAVPPALVERGLTGPGAANRLLGRLAEMQASTISSRTGRSTRGGGDELSVEIPQTGVSAGEIVRLLRRRLGRETIVTGELASDDSGGISLRVYADGVPLALPSPPQSKATNEAAPRASGLDRWFDRGAEAVFLHTDAYRYSTWLRFQADREAEGVDILRRRSTGGPPEERAWALSGLSVEARQQGRLEEALFLAEEAARLNPDLPNAYGNLAGVSGLLGHRERFLREQRRQTEAIERTEGRRAALRSLWVTQAILGDEGGALRSLEAVLAQPAPPGGFDVLLEGKAAVQAALHEATAARRTMAGLYQPHERGDQAMKDFAWWLLAPLEDWAGLEAELRAPSPPTDDPTFPTRTATRVQPRLAHAVARQGRHAEAAALIADTPLDCFWCVLNRGWVAALAGDADTADRWFAEAVRQGPSLPEAYSEWGEAKLLRGDTTGAIQLFGEARRRGPRWADPIKFEGDALARRGDHRAALRRYEDALERAPRWGAAHLAAGRSLQALGRGDQARARYEQAVQLDLSAADRAAVQRLLAGTRAAAPDVR